MTDQQTASKSSHPKDAHDNALVEALEAWGPLIAGGYECPAAGQRVLEAAERIKSLLAENEYHLSFLHLQDKHIAELEADRETLRVDLQRMRDALELAQGWLGEIGVPMEVHLAVSAALAWCQANGDPHKELLNLKGCNDSS